MSAHAAGAPIHTLVHRTLGWRKRGRARRCCSVLPPRFGGYRATTRVTVQTNDRE
jgi:hypothetical protein